LRRQQAFSQQDLEQITGVAQATLSDLERGKREVRASTIRKLADLAFGIHQHRRRAPTPMLGPSKEMLACGHALKRSLFAPGGRPKALLSCAHPASVSIANTNTAARPRPTLAPPLTYRSISLAPAHTPRYPRFPSDDEQGRLQYFSWESRQATRTPSSSCAA
jgi:DNA-binding XRE family transcriptional regulator